MIRWVLLFLFVATYFGIAARRLFFLPVGRPAAALIGACLMVAIAQLDPSVALHPDEALRAVEPNTIGLLMGTMIVSAALGLAGFFDRMVHALARRDVSHVTLLYATTIGCGLLSAVLVNDAVCLLATPLVLALVDRVGAPRTPFLFGIAMGSNAGSALTLGGNPQNMLVAKLSGLAYRDYLVHAAPAAIAALLSTAAILHWMHRRELSAERAPPSESAPPKTDRTLLNVSLFALVGMIVADLFGAHLAFTALVAAAVALLAARRHAELLLERVDWSVLVFFGSLFVVVASLQRTHFPVDALSWVNAHVTVTGTKGALVLSGVLSVGSQIVSNVPLILLLEPWIRALPDPHLAWTLTAVVSTLAGNLTVLGSVANVIVLDQAKNRGDVGFWQYARVGVPVTLVSTTLAIALVLIAR